MSLQRPGLKKTLAIFLLAALALSLWQYDARQLWETQRLAGLHQLQQHAFFDYCRILDAGGAAVYRGKASDCAERLALIAERGGNKNSAEAEHLVLLLHGLGRSPALFKKMERALRTQGYQAVAMAYPSLHGDISAHANNLNALLEKLEGVERVSFVTHSLGGLVVRAALGRGEAKKAHIEVERIVMIAPPNQGSQLAQALGEWKLFGLILGPSAVAIAEGIAPALPKLTGYEIGVVAGGTGADGFNPWLSGDDDGVVTVAETKLSGMQDFLLLEATHTFLPQKSKALEASLNFLEFGRFRPEIHTDNAPIVAEEGRA